MAIFAAIWVIVKISSAAEKGGIYCYSQKVMTLH